MMSPRISMRCCRARRAAGVAFWVCGGWGRKRGHQYCSVFLKKGEKEEKGQDEPRRAFVSQQKDPVLPSLIEPKAPHFHRHLSFLPR